MPDSKYECLVDSVKELYDIPPIKDGAAVTVIERSTSDHDDVVFRYPGKDGFTKEIGADLDGETIRGGLSLQPAVDVPWREREARGVAPFVEKNVQREEDGSIRFSAPDTYDKLKKAVAKTLACRNPAIS